MSPPSASPGRGARTLHSRRIGSPELPPPRRPVRMGMKFPLPIPPPAPPRARRDLDLKLRGPNSRLCILPSLGILALAVKEGEVNQNASIVGIREAQVFSFPLPVGTQHVWSESEDCLPFLQLAQDYISSCGKKTLHEVLEKVFKSFRPLLGLPDADDDAFEEYSADVEEEEPEADHPQMGVSQQ
ncbi:PREDICTED: maturin [Bison bison bison]|uniref:Maturin n=1 Tax=Bison bison bison TaxID=43346 RepID=A0A6P3GDU9_BISBB|nr:PREDICTED: maturin [Bison bison bison]